MKTLVVAPHADDEILGCGGTLLRRSDEGHEIAWTLVTKASLKAGFDLSLIEKKNKEITAIKELLKIQSSNFFQLDYKPASLDSVPLGQLISDFSSVFRKFEPTEIFLPFSGDIHSDHRVVFDAVCACTKCFRYPSVQKIYAYETLSETDFSLDPTKLSFRPTSFFDISHYLEKKIQLLNVYSSEISDFPFPRSETSIRALAALRGSRIGTLASESFMLLFEKN